MHRAAPARRAISSKLKSLSSTFHFVYIGPARALLPITVDAVRISVISNIVARGTMPRQAHRRSWRCRHGRRHDPPRQGRSVRASTLKATASGLGVDACGSMTVWPSTGRTSPGSPRPYHAGQVRDRWGMSPVREGVVGCSGPAALFRNRNRRGARPARDGRSAQRYRAPRKNTRRVARLRAPGWSPARYAAPTCRRQADRRRASSASPKRFLHVRRALGMPDTTSLADAEMLDTGYGGPGHADHR